MALPERKKPAERSKMIAAVVLGAVALISLAYMLLGSSSSSKPPTSGAKPKPSPATVAGRPTAQTPSDLRNDAGGFIPQEIRYGNESPPSVPEAERNIFAFYVPPPPKATPIPTPIPTPTPTPPNLVLASISPVNVYAHTSDFTLDVMGDKFTPDTHIYIGGAELPTRFVSPQQLSTKVPAQLISFEGARQLVVRSRDGQLFSSTATLNVMPAPVPNYILIGITLRPGSNDTAVLKEKSSSEVLNAQRGDIVGGRFRVTSISKSEVVLVDTTLKIKYPLLLTGDNSNPNATGQPRYQPPTSDEEPQL